MNALSNIVAAITAKQPIKSDLEIDAQTALLEAANFYAAAGYFAEAFAAKCAKHGKIKLIEAMGELGKDFVTTLDTLESAYPILSDLPFPKMSDEPVAIEPIKVDE